MTDRDIFYRHLGLPSLTPMDLEIERAEGVYFYDISNRDYMDLVAGITVSNTGHRHPAVLSAIRRQIDQYLHLNVYGEFIQSPQVRLARRLAELLPETLDSVYFVNSGSEAVEGAMKLAKRYTGRTRILSFFRAYHGSTQGSLSILGDECLKAAFRPLIPDVYHLRFNTLADLEMVDDQVAAVIFETVQAEAGIIPADQEFINALRDRCRIHGVLLILDDVQMGMGRTGRMFSFEHYGFVPDILILAKALGAGMPLGAFIAPAAMMKTLAFNPELGHITTFGGHPVSCAAGLAGLNLLVDENLIEPAEEKGRYFELLLSGHPSVGSIRRKGLALGIDLADPNKKSSFMSQAIACGVIIDWFLFPPATFRIAPPLTITFNEIDEACQRLNRALDSIA